MEFMYLVFTRMPAAGITMGDFGLLLCSCDVIRVLINSLCWLVLQKYGIWHCSLSLFSTTLNACLSVCLFVSLSLSLSVDQSLGLTLVKV